MSYLGIGYSGSDPTFLKDQVKKHMDWLKGDRLPRFYGNSFLVLYDSNTAREFAKKCINATDEKSVIVYQMGNPLN